MNLRALRQTVGALAVTALLGLPAAAQESADPIKLTINEWTGQHVTTYIMGEVLKKAGYSVEYVTAGYLPQFAGLKTGDLHVAMEIWATTGQEALAEAEASGGVVNAGEIGMEAIEEWWYPLYMKEKCPGLPDWQALRDCAEAFSVPETAPKGRYLGGPVDWGGFDEERVEALDMPFEVIHAGTDAALFAELESAYQRQAPIVLWVYSPHWAPVKFEGEWVEFPPYDKACYEDAATGINPDATHDCGKPRGAIWKVVWSGLPEKWPGAYKAIQAYTMDNDEMGALVSKVDLDGQTAEAVAVEWLGANEARWQEWIAK